MTQYKSLNVKLSNSQLNKLKSAIKNETGVALRLSFNMAGDDETNFPQKLLLTNRQVTNLHKAFANKSSTDIKLSNMVQSGRFRGRLLGPLLKTRLPLIKNAIKPLAKSVLIPLGLTAAASAADTGTHKNILGQSHCHFSSSIQNEAKEQKSGFLSMLLGTLGTSLLQNILAGKGINRAGEGILRAGYGNKKGQKTRTKRQDHKNKWDF